MSFGTERARERHNQASTKRHLFEDWDIETLLIALNNVADLHAECQNRCGLCHECGQSTPCATTRSIGEGTRT